MGETPPLEFPLAHWLSIFWLPLGLDVCIHRCPLFSASFCLASPDLSFGLGYCAPAFQPCFSIPGVWIQRGGGRFRLLHPQGSQGLVAGVACLIYAGFIGLPLGQAVVTVYVSCPFGFAQFPGCIPLGVLASFSGSISSAEPLS